MESGSDLSSRAVSSQVLSALKGLTSVFGMGTGGTPSSLPPEMVSYFIVSTCFRFRLSHCITFQSPCQALLCSFLYPDNCTTFMIQCPDRFPISLFVFTGFTQLIKRCNQALDLLVSSSSICYQTSTDDLSTW